MEKKKWIKKTNKTSTENILKGHFVMILSAYRHDWKGKFYEEGDP